jgi:NADH-quinone oxidoreductase subunit L
MGKSAQIPLYTWLPDAMAGPTPVSALIHAATMVTAGIYMITRSNILFSASEFTQHVVAIIGISTALLAATIAIKQNDIKKVLAYSTVSQLGYMFLGLGVGAYSGAVFHVITHAFFKALLFLGAGSVIHAMHHEQDIRKMGGLKSKLPVTHITFLIGCIAIAGVPPFSGFFSKDEILAAAFAKSPIYWALGVVGAAMTAFYMFRLYATTFLGKFRGTDEQAQHLHESPFAMTLPLILLALASAIAGAIGIPELMGGHHWLSHHLTPIVGETKEVALSHSTEWALMGASVSIAVIALFIAVNRYKRQADGEPQTALGKFLYNKWYVDELYNNAIVQPLNKFAGFLKETIEKNIIDGAVNGTGKIVQYSARKIRLIQNGQVGYYILFIVLGIILLFLFWFNDITINRFFNNLIK